MTILVMVIKTRWLVKKEEPREWPVLARYSFFGPRYQYIHLHFLHSSAYHHHRHDHAAVAAAAAVVDAILIAIQLTLYVLARVESRD